MGNHLLDVARSEAPPAAGAEVAVGGLRHSYGATAVLSGVDFGVEPGGHVAVMGRSGAGKSTLLALLGGLDRVQQGTIRVGGQALEHMGASALAAYRRGTVGFVFQHFGLLDALSALENVEIAMAVGGQPRRHQRRRATDLLERVGLAQVRGRRPSTLSGGERQRVAIARALANQPRLLLADEPTGSLDEETAAQVLEWLDLARAAAGCTLIVVTHERDVADRADRRLALTGGRLEPQP